MSDISNKVDDLKGKAKEATGEVTDNKDLQNEGKADQLLSDVKDKISEAGETVKEKANEVLGKIQDKLDDDEKPEQPQA